MRKVDIKTLEAAEMWFTRRMLKVPWTARKSNSEVMETANFGRKMTAAIEGRQCKFLGHVIRKVEVGNLVISGKSQGQKSCGRQRAKLLGNFKDSLEIFVKSYARTFMLFVMAQDVTKCLYGSRLVAEQSLL